MISPDDLTLVSDLCVAYGFTIERHGSQGKTHEFHMWNGGRAWILTVRSYGLPSAILDVLVSGTPNLVAVSSFQIDLRTAVNNVLKRA